MNVRILALCAGYGGLETAVTAGMGGVVAAFAENDPHAAAVFTAHHPGVPNLGDITRADWHRVRDEFRPTVVAAGFPCRNISNAGDRTGIDGQFSRVWKNVAEAVGVVRPRYVFLENVAAILRRGLGTVLGDLAGHGYDARWTCLRASEEEIGAPHPRYRWFCLAYPAVQDSHLTARGQWRPSAPGEAEGGRARADAGGRSSLPAPAPAGSLSLLPTPAARDWKSGASNLLGHNARPLNEVVVNLLPGQAVRLDDRWVAGDGTDYGPAIRRWERVTGRAAPCPTEPGTRGNRRLSPAFTEWMMGLPEGWVTAVPGIPRSEQLRILGNGVVWQQAHEGYSRLFSMDTNGLDDMSTETEQAVKPERPRGMCTGCGFEYTLSPARKGEHKGELVTRKHNSRTGPGLCDGAQKPPESESCTAECAENGHMEPGVCTVTEDGISDDPGTPLFTAGYDSDGSCGHPVYAGDEIRADGEGGFLCADCSDQGPVQDRPQHIHDDGNGGVWVHEGLKGSCTLPECMESLNNGICAPTAVSVTHDGEADGRADRAPMPTAPVDTFADPAPMPAELPPVSGQPEPDRDRWGRYLILGQSHTRATTFAKLGSSTFALGEWNERMLIKGLVQRPDLLAMAHGLDVKRDKKTLNQIADDAQTHAGNKVAANIGTAYHAFTERLDAGLISLQEVPEAYRLRCGQYVARMREHGLTTRPEWIERTTAVWAGQVSAPVPVAGTLDRILQLPNGELVIGDLKTGSDLSYGWVEIAVQLAIYAHGVNTFGLFDWRSKEWENPQRLPVRTDYAIVMHLPADGDGCTLYRVDLVKGWKYAQVSGEVQSRQKDKSVAGVLVPGSLAERVWPPVAQEVPETPMDRAYRIIGAATHPDELTGLYGFAEQSGAFTVEQLDRIKALCARRWEALRAQA